ncbi:farnesyl pyrophosphate synthetase-like protein [Leptotrombidium deliense]|uniref:Farnesyl pyrophosphate synthase n=1 Tax=Leptotrombidium deliense TaxID=299467 RepID=A0A443S067_9ACAR|nr:farnesyl pyrophosphate synthetase-like protein [Leptotrombidium deliense]
MDQLFEYCVYGGKMLRIKLLLKFFEEIATKEERTKLREKALLLGICVHLLVSAWLVIDDQIDESETRRGKRCWYKLEPKAIHHAKLLVSFIFTILKNHFRSDPNYRNVLKLCLTADIKTGIGQNMDMLLSNPKALDKYTISVYNRMVSGKTAYCTFILPVRLCLCLLNLTDKKLRHWATSVAQKIGILFQAQDDFIDVYGDSNQTGKIGTDIRNGKCTWLVVHALTIMNENQRHTFVQHFGKNDDESENIVKDIFQQINMKQKFYLYEIQEFEDILNEISKIDEKYENIASAIRNVATIFYQRKK